MMRRLLCFLSLALTAAGSRADLNSDVEAVLAQKLLAKVHTGIVIVKLGEGPESSPVVYSHNPTDPLIPASNLKVVTTSAALDALGPDFRFRTVLARRGDDLVLIGDGDPTTGNVEYLKKVGWDATTLFRNWAEALKASGVTRVANVYVDDSIFEEASFHPHWPAGQNVLRYSAEVGGLNLNANCVDFTFTAKLIGEPASYREAPETAYLNVTNRVVGGDSNAINPQRPITTNNLTLSGTCPASGGVSATVHDPAMFTGTVLAETLKASGMEVTGSVTRDRTIRAAISRGAATTASTTQPASGWTLLAVNETPLLQVMAHANKDSVNLYAEAIGKRLGAAATGQSGSWENGTAAVATFLQKAGVGPDEFHLDDGCGLSHENKVSANAMVHVLAYDYLGKNRAAYMATLSIAGTDGTLEKRFPPPNTDLRGRVFGKSGFVEGVSSVSGFLHAKDDNWYAFSILMNGIPRQSNSLYKTLQEQIVRAIDNEAAVGQK